MYLEQCLCRASLKMNQVVQFRSHLKSKSASSTLWTLKYQLSTGTWYSTGTMETENDNIEIFSKYKREENLKNSYMSVPSFSFVAWCIMLVNNESRKRLYHPFKNTTSIYIFKHNFCNLICNKVADLRSTCVSVVLYRMNLTDLYMYFAVKDKTICEAGLKDPM